MRPRHCYRRAPCVERARTAHVASTRRASAHTPTTTHTTPRTYDARPHLSARLCLEHSTRPCSPDLLWRARCRLPTPPRVAPLAAPIRHAPLSPAEQIPRPSTSHVRPQLASLIRRTVPPRALVHSPPESPLHTSALGAAHKDIVNATSDFGALPPIYLKPKHISRPFSLTFSPGDMVFTSPRTDPTSTHAHRPGTQMCAQRMHTSALLHSRAVHPATAPVRLEHPPRPSTAPNCLKHLPRPFASNIHHASTPRTYAVRVHRAHPPRAHAARVHLVHTTRIRRAGPPQRSVYDPQRVPLAMLGEEDLFTAQSLHANLSHDLVRCACIHLPRASITCPPCGSTLHIRWAYTPHIRRAPPPRTSASHLRLERSPHTHIPLALPPAHSPGTFPWRIHHACLSCASAAHIRRAACACSPCAHTALVAESARAHAPQMPFLWGILSTHPDAPLRRLLRNLHPSASHLRCRHPPRASTSRIHLAHMLQPYRAPSLRASVVLRPCAALYALHSIDRPPNADSGAIFAGSRPSQGLTRICPVRLMGDGIHPLRRHRAHTLASRLHPDHLPRVSAVRIHPRIHPAHPQDPPHHVLDSLTSANANSGSAIVPRGILAVVNAELAAVWEQRGVVGVGSGFVAASRTGFASTIRAKAESKSTGTLMGG
ncbi:hypothetical protein C8F04DRAFT_1264295 [Mycena alexandri]|uniref:Uncharacterized protein n=1 Tax=Mycena alexandri TaxID=1745969 RepID=A0AAD6X2N1_9AGAR|nr:hypothetical protein C8F04DRAFT_1264295 [Mycena alexandri]